jgi:hypothetical protein
MPGFNIDGYCWTCGEYRRLSRASLLCEPCECSWASRTDKRQRPDTWRH